MYKARTYRSWTVEGDLVFFEVIEKETDLAIYAKRDLERQARAAVLTLRQEIEDYIRLDRRFFESLDPVEIMAGAPQIVRAMASAARRASVGPMASVAGAVAEAVGRELSQHSEEIIVENGGDIFLATAGKRSLGIYAGEGSPYTGKLAIEVGPAPDGLGVCTSSGTVSHSLSFGKSDAVVIISEDAALADAAATAAGNIVRSPDDIPKGIERARSIDGVMGVLIIAGDKMGSWGDVRLI
jgi:ApbE superfamily uncharacterized protein (UPF0280 family)